MAIQKQAAPHRGRPGTGNWNRDRLLVTRAPCHVNVSTLFFRNAAFAFGATSLWQAKPEVILLCWQLPLLTSRVICKHAANTHSPRGDAVLGLIRLALVVALPRLLAYVPACGKSGSITIPKRRHQLHRRILGICEAGANKAAEERQIDLRFVSRKELRRVPADADLASAWAKKCERNAVGVIGRRGRPKTSRGSRKKVH